MSLYLTYKEIREFEDKFGYKKIQESNKIIGIALGFKPKVSYAVGDGEGYCYSLNDSYFSDENSQKREAERWLNEQITTYPEGWVAKDGYKVIKIEEYPMFHQDWNELIEALKRIEKGKSNFTTFHDNIFKTWEILLDYIMVLKINYKNI